MTLLSYIHLIWRTTRQRSAVKRAHGGKLPFLLPETDVTGDAPNENIPVAEVVRTDTAFDGEQPSTQDNMNSHTDRSVPAMNTARNPAFEASPPTSEPHLQEMDTSVRVQQQDGSVVTAPGPVAEAAMDRKQESYSSFDNMPKGIMLPADIPESAEVTAAEAEKSRRGVKGFLKRQWESVCEDPSIGFKCAAIDAQLLGYCVNRLVSVHVCENCALYYCFWMLSCRMLPVIRVPVQVLSADQYVLQGYATVVSCCSCSEVQRSSDL